MNIFLWIVQIFLALLAFAGGAYKVFAFDQVAGSAFYAALPRAGWGALGIFEVVCAVLLILYKWKPRLTLLAAAALALETIGLSILYARYSLELNAANPLIWSALMAVLAIFVAIGRYPR